MQRQDGKNSVLPDLTLLSRILFSTNIGKKEVYATNTFQLFHIFASYLQPYPTIQTAKRISIM